MQNQTHQNTNANISKHIKTQKEKHANTQKINAYTITQSYSHKQAQTNRHFAIPIDNKKKIYIYSSTIIKRYKQKHRNLTFKNHTSTNTQT